MPVTPILRLCDQWHMSSIADTMDGHLASMAVLRRDLVSQRSILRETGLSGADSFLG